MPDMEVQKSHDILFDALDNMEEGMVVYDADGYLLACNRSFRDMYHYSEAQAASGVNCDDLGVIDVHNGNYIVGDEGGGNSEDFFQRKWAYRKKLQGSLTVKLQDGRWIRTTDRAMPNGGFVSVHVDITEIKHAQEKIQQGQQQLAELNINLEQQVADRTLELELARSIAEQQARTDSLTGINNRRAFFELANTIHQRTSRYKNSYAAIIIDIDNFKLVNDNYGHLVGDEVIVALANSIQSQIRTVDVSGRIGGDEFSIILPNSSATGARNLAERLSSSFRKTVFPVNGCEPILTVSIGIAEVCADDSEIKNVLARADIALYSAKQQGRDHIELLHHADSPNRVDLPVKNEFKSSN
ncbi:MAG: diguanylate cyclase (GGDEF)-like protein [Gammaproteobacteria bacterium]|jgi:diguanylate cyclase (GGDEF)-like protein